LPTYGSAAILNARALNGSLSSTVRRTSAWLVERRREVVDDRVEHRLDALVLEG
jgi:hypothetical protein